MVVKQGKYGKFLACSGYPQCTQTHSVNANNTVKDTGISCPQINCDGSLVEKTSKRGKIFYGCNRYPTCSFATWEKPVSIECPRCGAKFLVEKTTKREGTFYSCLTQGCGYKEKIGGQGSE